MGKGGLLQRGVAYCLVLLMTLTGNLPAAPVLPPPDALLTTGLEREAPVLEGLRLDPQDPLHISFVIDTGSEDDVSEEQVRTLVRYFLAGLTMPEDDVWVNLSPDEPDRIIEDDVAATELGRDLLEQDYLLKQLASSLTHPDTPTGEAYWRVENGKSTIENRLGKIWIVPDKAEVYEHATIGVIKTATLKLESEAPEHAVLIPALTREINEGEHFAKLRQIYHSLILARWFKDVFKESLYKHYIDQKKMNGIDINDPQAKERIYELYTESFRKGVYDEIARDRDPLTRRLMKRRYVSGGIAKLSSAVSRVPVVASSTIKADIQGRQLKVDIRLGSNTVKSFAGSSIASGGRLPAEQHTKFSELVHRGILLDAFASKAEEVVALIGDFIGQRGRINTPGTMGEHNWTIRMPADCTLADLINAAKGHPSTGTATETVERIRFVMKKSGRATLQGDFFHGTGGFVPGYRSGDARDYGIGDNHARKLMLEFMQLVGLNLMYELPTYESSFGESPYSIKTRLHEPTQIDVDDLLELYPCRAAREHLDAREPVRLAALQKRGVDYKTVREIKLPAFRQIFNEHKERILADGDFRKFVDENRSWLENDALYNIFNERYAHDPRIHNGWSFLAWPAELRMRNQEALKRELTDNADEVAYQMFLEWVYKQQNDALKKMAEAAGQQIMGDHPIAPPDSLVWQHPEAFGMEAPQYYSPFTQIVPADMFGPPQFWQFPPPITTLAVDLLLQELEREFGYAHRIRVDHGFGPFRQHLAKLNTRRELSFKALGVWDSIAHALRQGAGLSYDERKKLAAGIYAEYLDALVNVRVLGPWLNDLFYDPSASGENKRLKPNNMIYAVRRARERNTLQRWFDYRSNPLNRLFDDPFIENEIQVWLESNGERGRDEFVAALEGVLQRYPQLAAARGDLFTPDGEPSYAWFSAWKVSGDTLEAEAKTVLERMIAACPEFAGQGLMTEFGRPDFYKAEKMMALEKEYTGYNESFRYRILDEWTFNNEPYHDARIIGLGAEEGRPDRDYDALTQFLFPDNPELAPTEDDYLMPTFYRYGPGEETFMRIKELAVRVGGSISGEFLGISTPGIEKSVQKLGLITFRAYMFGFPDNPDNMNSPNRWSDARSHIILTVHDEDSLASWWENEKKVPLENRQQILDRASQLLYDGDDSSGFGAVQNEVAIDRNAERGSSSLRSAWWNLRATRDPAKFLQALADMGRGGEVVKAWEFLTRSRNRRPGDIQQLINKLRLYEPERLREVLVRIDDVIRKHTTVYAEAVLVRRYDVLQGLEVVRSGTDEVYFKQVTFKGMRKDDALPPVTFDELGSMDSISRQPDAALDSRYRYDNVRFDVEYRRIQEFRDKKAILDDILSWRFSSSVLSADVMRKLYQVAAVYNDLAPGYVFSEEFESVGAAAIEAFRLNLLNEGVTDPQLIAKAAELYAQRLLPVLNVSADALKERATREVLDGGVAMKGLDVASSGTHARLSFDNVDPSLFDDLRFEVVSISELESVAKLGVDR